MGQCYATFSGVDSVRRATMARTLGVFPNAAHLICLPQLGSLPAIGQLVIAHGVDFVSFPDMKVDWSTVRLSTNGHQLHIKLLDRRWRWRFCEIWGRYNARLADGTIDTATQKTARELAAMCFDAMGELNYSVTALPDDVYPETDWIGEKAAFWLHELCENCGCDISLNLDDSVSIVQLSVGSLLPDNLDLQSPSLTVNPPEGPDRVGVICGENQYQSRLACRSVALDTDGQIKSWNDPDLSYRPSGGWVGISEVEYIQQLRANGCTEAQLSCARKSLFKWFQVITQADGSQAVPGYGSVGSITQILPLNSYLLESYTAFTGTQKTNKPCKVYENARILENPPNDLNRADFTETDSDFSLDGKLGIVKFSRAMVQHLSSGEILPADVYLETSYGVRENNTDQSDRYVATADLVVGGGFLIDSVRKEELSLISRAIYASGSPTTVVSVVDNEAALIAETENILAILAAKWISSLYGHAIYRGILPINTDGAIRQTSWTVSTDNTSQTTASLNMEGVPGVVRLNERSRRRILAQNGDINPRAHYFNKLRRGGLMR